MVVLRLVGKGSCCPCELRRGLVGEGGAGEDNGRCCEEDMRKLYKNERNKWAENVAERMGQIRLF
jgi:hypothetical protein